MHIFIDTELKLPWCPKGFLKSSIDLKLREMLMKKRIVLFSYISSQHKDLMIGLIWVIGDQFKKCNYKVIFLKEEQFSICHNCHFSDYTDQIASQISCFRNLNKSYLILTGLKPKRNKKVNV